VQASGLISAGEIVYLADKMLQGVRYIPLEERFEARLKLYADNPEACRAVTERFKNAMIIRARLESLPGFPLHKILTENGFK
jgi:hypothetical protein